MNDLHSEHAETINQLRKTAVRSAIVAGVFSLIIVGLLVVNYLQITVLDPVRAEKLDMLKLRVAERPDDAQLLSDIRREDLQIRHDRIRRQNISRTGVFLLLGGLIVFLISAKTAAGTARRIPRPQASSEQRTAQLRQAKLARRAILASLIMLFVFTAVLALMSGKDLAEPEPRGTPYASAEELAHNWPRFRGPGGSGISNHADVPMRFDPSDSQSLLWQSDIPLSGFNSPIVWDDRVFLSGADKNRHEVYCFDAESGKLLWIGRVPYSAPGSEKIEPWEETGFAASTMATDGRRVYAIFATADVAAFTMEGRRLWARNLGTPDKSYGYAGSLEVYRGTVLIQYDPGNVAEGKSRLIAIDGFSGQIVWEINRPVAGSWASPILAQTSAGPHLITCSDPWVIAYDPQTGHELWRANCLGADVAPSPIYAGGLVLAIHSNYNEAVALRPDGAGDVTDTHIAWKIDEGIPDICSPVSNGDLLFLLTTGGTLTCYSIKDGTKLWDQELDKTFNASPSLVGDRLYLLSEDGTMIVAHAGSEYRELARSELADTCRASPAFADGRMFIRGNRKLYGIGNASGE